MAMVPHAARQSQYRIAARVRRKTSMKPRAENISVYTLRVGSPRARAPLRDECSNPHQRTLVGCPCPAVQMIKSQVTHGPGEQWQWQRRSESYYLYGCAI